MIFGEEQKVCSSNRDWQTIVDVHHLMVGRRCGHGEATDTIWGLELAVKITRLVPTSGMAGFDPTTSSGNRSANYESGHSPVQAGGCCALSSVIIAV